MSRTGPVGRDIEIAEATAALDGLASGAVGLVLSGPAGIGKTTTWRAILDDVRARGWRVLETRAVEAEAQLPFGGLADLLDPVIDEVLDRLPSAQRVALEVALQRVPAGGQPPAPLAASLATLGALRALAETGPVVVAIDDVPWLDGASARVLAYAARRLGDTPVAFAGTVRAADPDGPLPPPVDQLEPRPHRLHLGPLGLEDIGELLAAQVRVPLRRPALAWIHEQSGGNPFLALEIGRAIERAGVVPGRDGIALPSAPGGLVRDRLDTLPASTREPLAAVAALTRPTTDLVLAAFPEAGPALAAAQAAGVLVDERDRLRFAHPLLAAGASSLVDDAARRRIHARLADVVPGVEERARHRALSVEGSSASVAAELEAAAVQAHARGAADAAAELVLLAARRTPASDEEGTHRRTLAAGTWLLQAGDPVRALQLLEARAAELPAGPRRAEVLLVLADARSSDAWPAKVRLLEGALDEAADDHGLRGRILESLSQAVWQTQAGAQRARELALEAVAEAEQQEDPVARVSAYGSAVFAIQASGEGRATDLLDRAMALAPKVEHLRVFLWPAFVLALVDEQDDRLSQSLERLAGLRHRAEAMGDWDSAPLICNAMAHVTHHLGRPAEALALAREAERGARAIGQPLSVALGLESQTAIETTLGRFDEAENHGREAVRLAEEIGAASTGIDARSWLGTLALARGDVDHAVELLEAPTTDRLRGGYLDPGDLWMLPALAEALIGVGRTADAATMLEPFEAVARRLDRASALAAAARIRGLLAAAAGDEAAAGDAFAAALRQHDRIDRPLERGRTLLAQGESLRRFRRRGQARDALEAAIAVFDATGAAGWRERAARELARTGYREAGDSLTATERQIAELVAAGRTNREVAEVLFMSPHTVEAHLTRIYRSLGVRGRAALGRALAGSGAEGARSEDEGPG